MAPHDTLNGGQSLAASTARYVEWEECRAAATARAYAAAGEIADMAYTLCGDRMQIRGVLANCDVSYGCPQARAAHYQLVALEQLNSKRLVDLLPQSPFPEERMMGVLMSAYDSCVATLETLQAALNDHMRARQPREDAAVAGFRALSS